MNWKRCSINRTHLILFFFARGEGGNTDNEKLRVYNDVKMYKYTRLQSHIHLHVAYNFSSLPFSVSIYDLYEIRDSIGQLSRMNMANLNRD